MTQDGKYACETGGAKVHKGHNQNVYVSLVKDACFGPAQLCACVNLLDLSRTHKEACIYVYM